MRCDYSYQLSKWQCHSIDKTPTLRFCIEGDGTEVVDCCPVCANLLESELQKQHANYRVVAIEKGEN